MCPPQLWVQKIQKLSVQKYLIQSHIFVKQVFKDFTKIQNGHHR